MSLCLLATGKVTAFAVAAFSLAWTHSVEKTRWEEDWRIVGDRLEIVEARVKGSGAGMEPPDGAVLKDGWWVYAPVLPPQRQVVLAASGATAGGWQLCMGKDCLSVGEDAGEPARLFVCVGP
jgi:hypothetical protein